MLQRIENEHVLGLWSREFTTYNPRYRQDMIAPIQNKVGAFLDDPKLRRIFMSSPEYLSFRSIMGHGIILIVNGSKGRLGEDSPNLLGALLVTTLGLTAMSRGDQPESQRRLLFIHR